MGSDAVSTFSGLVTKAWTGQFMRELGLRGQTSDAFPAQHLKSSTGHVTHGAFLATVHPETSVPLCKRNCDLF